MKYEINRRIEEELNNKDEEVSRMFYEIYNLIKENINKREIANKVYRKLDKIIKGN